MTAMQIPWRLGSFLEVIFVRELSASSAGVLDIL